MFTFPCRNTRLILVLSLLCTLLYYYHQHQQPAKDHYYEVFGGFQAIATNATTTSSPQHQQQSREEQQLKDTTFQRQQPEAMMLSSDLVDESSNPGIISTPQSQNSWGNESLTAEVNQDSQWMQEIPIARVAAATQETQGSQNLQQGRGGESGNWVPPVLPPSNGTILQQIDITSYPKKDQKFLQRHMNKMVSRAETLSAGCRVRGKLARRGPLHLVWDTQRSPSLLYCPIYKVGSTSWMMNFLRLAHFNEDNPELLKLPKKKRKRLQFSAKYGAKQDKVYELYPPPTDLLERERIFNDSLRMLVVRHPFARLISAYRDKMLKKEPRPKEHRFRELQLEIIRKYRRNTEENSPFPTFPEFIMHVLDSTSDLTTREAWLGKVKCWLPYWVQCNVCAADYNLVLKLETMEQDQRFVATLTNMKLKDTEWRHLQQGTQSEDLIAQYFSQLSKHQIRTLYNRYMLDFILFDYKYRSVLKNAKDS